MMKKYFPLIIAGGIFCFTACQKDVEVSFDKFEDLLVVNSQFSKDSIFRINVSASRSTIDNTPLKNLKDAKVELFEEGTLLETLTTYIPSPHEGVENKERRGYFVSSMSPQVGKKYTVKVAVDGYESVEASDKIPENTVQVEEFAFLGQIESEAQFRLKFKDLSNETNAYHILLVTRSIYINHQRKDTIIDNPRYVHYNILGKDTGNDLIKDDVDEGVFVSSFSNPGYLLEDKNFNTDTKEFILTAYGLGKYFNDKEGEEYHKLMNIEIRSVSQDYYKYQRSLSLQEENKDDPFVEPVFIFNNVENGLGNFSAYNKINSEEIDIWE